MLFLLIAAISLGCGDGLVLRRGFLSAFAGIGGVGGLELSDVRFCAVSVPFVRFSSGCTKGLAPRILFLSELLLFLDLQAFVSAVAFARGTEALPKLAC